VRTDEKTKPMAFRPKRFLVVVADDFGMGPHTSAGILDVADRGAITASVLLVNSPHAEQAVRSWRQRGCPMELGWHPNLTLDAPLSPSYRVPSLVGRDGKLCPLNGFLRRWSLGGLNAQELERELAAQLERFRDLVGYLPTVVNTHQHVGVFAPVGDILMKVLKDRGCRPYLRRVREPLGSLLGVPGARVKRALLNLQGRRLAKRQEKEEFPGNDWLAGITDPPWVKNADFFRRWLHAVPGQQVELMCHPGYQDPTLLGRDCQIGDGLLQRRVDELLLLKNPTFLEAVHDAGFTLATPLELCRTRPDHVNVA
jgi:chitin disaccharide deacetylase